MGSPTPIKIGDEAARAMGLAYHGDSLLVAAQGENTAAVVVYDLQLRKQLGVLFANQLNGPEHLAVRKDGTVAISQQNGTAVIGNVATGELAGIIRPPAAGQGVAYLGFLPEGELLAIFQDIDNRGTPNEFLAMLYDIAP